jgi:hypothetical protein
MNENDPKLLRVKALTGYSFYDPHTCKDAVQIGALIGRVKNCTPPERRESLKRALFEARPMPKVGGV